MTPTREEALAALDDLYAQLPNIDCRGLCHDSCTSIDGSELERQRVAERGVKLPVTLAHRRLKQLIAAHETPRCPALGPLNTCTVYEVRPMICRAFGLVYDPHLLNPANTQPMMCDHGCVPDATITSAELARILRAIEELSQQVTGVRRRPA